jgi:hypothetical protein
MSSEVLIKINIFWNVAPYKSAVNNISEELNICIFFYEKNLNNFCFWLEQQNFSVSHPWRRRKNVVPP